MRKFALSLAVLGAVAAPLLVAAPANAQAPRTWVASNGDDAFPCSRTQPCKTFAGALVNTQVNGEINCVDAFGYGSVTITKSITIDCAGTYASILASNTNGITIITEPNIKVIVRNLTINGTPGSGGLPGFYGIRFLTSGTLHLDNVMVQNFTGAGSGFGIDFTPNGAAKLLVSNSYFENNGTATTGGGIRIRPSASGTTAVISKTAVNRGLQGIVADGSGGGTINVSVHDSVVSANANDGVLATSPSLAVNILVDRSDVFNNGTGLRAAGGSSQAIIRVGNSTISANGVATATVGGQVLSYLNNFINANGVDTTPPMVPGGMH
jgi:hypothetical protein